MSEVTLPADLSTQTTPLPDAPELPSIVQVSRPYFTSAEISHLHLLTIKDHDKVKFARTKQQIALLLYQIIKMMKFPIRVLNTGLNFYQRWYLFNKFDDEVDDPFMVGLTCIFLASKNEDCIKKLKDIQIVANKLREVNYTEQYLEQQRKTILGIEFKLLQVIKFDFLNGSLLGLPSLDKIVTMFSRKLHLQYKLTFTNWLIAYDLISTPLVLMVPPHCISLAIIIVSLNLRLDVMVERGSTDDEDQELILDSIDSKEFRCKELLVNESILYILDYYIHNFDHLVLKEYMPAVDSITGKEQTFKFMDLKSRFNDLNRANEKVAGKRHVLEDDGYLKGWDYNIAAKGSARFMMANKRARFEKEIEGNKA